LATSTTNKKKNGIGEAILFLIILVIALIFFVVGITIICLPTILGILLLFFRKDERNNLALLGLFGIVYFFVDIQEGWLTEAFFGSDGFLDSKYFRYILWSNVIFSTFFVGALLDGLFRDGLFFKNYSQRVYALTYTFCIVFLVSFVYFSGFVTSIVL